MIKRHEKYSGEMSFFSVKQTNTQNGIILNRQTNKITKDGRGGISNGEHWGGGGRGGRGEA